MSKTIALDVDGVLAKYDGWSGVDHFGEPIEGAVEFTKKLKQMGFDIIIHTCRCSEGINKPEKGHLLGNRVRDYLDEHGFVYDHIHIEGGKPIASFYIDDNAIRCRPQDDPAAFIRVINMIKIGE